MTNLPTKDSSRFNHKADTQAAICGMIAALLFYTLYAFLEKK